MYFFCFARGVKVVKAVIFGYNCLLRKELKYYSALYNVTLKLYYSTLVALFSTIFPYTTTNYVHYTLVWYIIRKSRKIAENRYKIDIFLIALLFFIKEYDSI
jgi:hypothetical protein